MELGVTTRTLTVDYIWDALYEELYPILTDELHVKDVQDDITAFHDVLYLKRKDGTTYVNAKRFPTNREDKCHSVITDGLTIKGVGAAENTVLLSFTAQLLSICQREDLGFVNKLEELLHVDNNSRVHEPFGDFANVLDNISTLFNYQGCSLPDVPVCYEDIDFIWHAWLKADDLERIIYSRDHWRENHFYGKPRPLFPNLYGVIVSRDGKPIVVDHRKKSLFQKISNFLNKKVA